MGQPGVRPLLALSVNIFMFIGDLVFFPFLLFNKYHFQVPNQIVNTC